MKESYKKDSHHHYLILEIEENLQENEYPIKMITYNQIPGLLKCDVRRMNGSLSFYYEITSKQSAARIFEKSGIGYKDMRQILSGIKRGLDGASGYLLDENSFLIDPEHFYMDVQSREVFLCYVPGRRGDFQKELQNLAEYILKNLDHGEERAVILGYEIYRRVMEENGSADDVLQLAYQEIQSSRIEKKGSLSFQESEREDKREYQKEKRKRGKEDRLEEENGQSKEERKRYLRKWGIRFLVAVAAAVILTGIILSANFMKMDLTRVGGVLSVLIALAAYTVSFVKSRREGERRDGEKREEKSRERKRKEEKRKRIKNTEGRESVEKKENKRIDQNDIEAETEECEETEILTFGETVLLDTGKTKSKKMLISREKEKSPDICISCSNMIIGKIRQQADFVLDDEHISRIHARIEKNGDDVYVMDLNSTNGTFINGERLQANERRRLQPSDEIAFASITYEYETE